MKVHFQQSSLAGGLSTVGHAVTARGHLPILANIKLTTEHDRVQLEATNLEFGVQCWVDATVVEAGSTTLPAKLLTDFVSILPHNEITIEIPDGSQEGTITSELSQATIPVMDPAEFPNWPQIDPAGLSFVMEAQAFKAMVKGVAFAASSDEQRPVLTGICLQFHQDADVWKITCAAADTYRLAVCTESLADGAEGAYGATEIVVPATTLKQIASILPGSDKVAIHVTSLKNQIVFQTDIVNVASRVMDGQYPNFRAMIPKVYDTRLVVEARLFGPIIKTAALFAQDTYHTVTLKIKPEAGTITVDAFTEGVGANTSTIAASYTQVVADILLRFNVKYIADVLSTLGDASEIALEVRNSSSLPGLMRPVGAKDALYLVMPMQTKQEKQSAPVAAATT